MFINVIPQERYRFSGLPHLFKSFKSKENRDSGCCRIEVTDEETFPYLVDGCLLFKAIMARDGTCFDKRVQSSYTLLSNLDALLLHPSWVSMFSAGNTLTAIMCNLCNGETQSLILELASCPTDLSFVAAIISIQRMYDMHDMIGQTNQLFTTTNP